MLAAAVAGHYEAKDIDCHKQCLFAGAHNAALHPKARRSNVRQRTDTAAAPAHIDHWSNAARWRKASRPLTGVHQQEQAMGINKDQVEGRVKEAKGTIKEVAGKLVGNESLEVKGKVQKNVGKVQAKFGDVKEDLKDAKKPL
jgi:uncharacterized protein YjbJ (UPF0337 family)